MNVEKWQARNRRTSVRIPTFASSAPLTPKQQAQREDLQRRYRAALRGPKSASSAPLTPRQQAQREDLQRRYQAVVDEDARKRKQQEDMLHRFLLAVAAELGQKAKWKNIHEFRRIYGDERTNPPPWPKMPWIMKYHRAILKRNAGETLSAAERIALNS